MFLNRNWCQLNVTHWIGYFQCRQLYCVSREWFWYLYKDPVKTEVYAEWKKCVRNRERQLGCMGSRLALQGGRKLCWLHRSLTCKEQMGKEAGQQAGKERGVKHERWGLHDTYVKANATRAPLTTIKSRMFHRSRKYEPGCMSRPKSTIWNTEKMLIRDVEHIDLIWNRNVTNLLSNIFKSVVITE